MTNVIPIWQLGAVELAKSIREGKFTATEVTRVILQRVKDRNPHINAIVDDMSEEALARAGELDQLKANGSIVGPLHGVPITIKVNIDVKGRANTNGVAALADVIAPADAPLVAQMRQAGAIIIGLTNTPEFSFRATTDNELYGRTINPWDEQRSPGGSSGGAAAAVAAGFGPLAHGNDIGGSLRFPSFCCGAVTVKPSQGRVASYNPSFPSERSIIAQLFATQGFIAREVADVRMAMEVITQKHVEDAWQPGLPFPGPALDGPIKVAVIRKSNGYPIQQDILDAIDRTANILDVAGYVIEEAEPPCLEALATDALPILFSDTWLFTGNVIERIGSETTKKIFSYYFENYPRYDAEELLRAMARRTGYMREWARFQQEYPLVLTPFLMRSTYEWDEDQRSAASVKDLFDSSLYSWSMNLLGLPAAIAPAGYVDGLPISVQLVGQRYREDLCLDAAATIEKVTGCQIHELWRRNGERR